jgi:hypothetical protein
MYNLLVEFINSWLNLWFKFLVESLATSRSYYKFYAFGIGG